ncbi:MAG: translational GTPase TypA, partial [Bacteroidales bacterium]|nr:translational GTPase TypA [Bacteroidales bacterium]
LRVELTSSEDRFTVFGRGILHLSILIETMRREKYELQVGKPQVIIKNIDGIKSEPYEILVIDVPESFSGKAIELVTQRKGDLLVMEPKGDLQHLEFDIPSRGLIGLRNNLLTATAGEAVMTHRLRGFDTYKGDIPTRNKGSLVSMESGQALAYAIDRLQDRGRFFIEPGEKVYKGQVIGEYTRERDLEINVIKGKKLSNMRAAGTDDAAKIAPRIKFSLEEALEYIKDDEYVELTPKSIRMRKIG